MFEREYLGVWDLRGRDVTVSIKKVRGATLTAPGGIKQKKPVVWFDRTDKALILNKTMAATIQSMYGSDTVHWVGKLITLYPTTTKFGKETVECIRVRPTIPKGKAESVKSAPVDPETRAKQDRAAGQAGQR